MSTHVEYLDALYVQMEYTDERNLADVVEDVEARDVLVIGGFGDVVVVSGPKDRLLAMLREAVEAIEQGAKPFVPEVDEDLRCGECGRTFDTLEDLEAHEAELDGK